MTTITPAAAPTPPVAADKPLPSEAVVAPAAAAGGAAAKTYNEFLVLLDDQANRAVEKAFKMKVGPERRQYVAKTLIDNMMKTQQPLWDVLDGLEHAGHVGSYQPLWIQNAIVVDGDETAEAVMSSAAGVAQATRSAHHLLDTPSATNGKFEPEVIAGVNDVTAVDPAEGKDDPQWNLTRMKVANAAKEKLDGSGVTVGVIDTGVDVSHPALKDKYRGYDPATGSSSHTANWYDATEEASPEPVDKGEHGTHVMGTIGGKFNGDQTGVAPGVQFIAARGLGEQGGSDGMLLKSFQAMVAPRVPTPGVSPGSRRELGLGADVINNSWGSVDGLSMSYANALRNMDAMGVINVFAAGNDGQGGKAGSVGSPGSSPHIVTVGAIDKSDKVAEFSSRGPNPIPTSDGEPVPFVSAPGVDIRSSIPGGGYERGWQGTSMATPAITGFIALAQQAAQEETGAKFDTAAMRDVLKRVAQDVDEKGVDDNTGYGVPVVNNLRKAVIAVAKDRGLMETKPAPKKAPAKA